MKKVIIFIVAIMLPSILIAIGTCDLQVGYTTIGGTANPALSGLILADAVTFNASGTCPSAEWYFTSPSGNARVALYTDNAGSPGNVLGNSNSQGLISGWNVFTFISGAAVTANQPGWIAMMVDNNTAAEAFDTTPWGRKFLSQGYGGGFPNAASWTNSGTIRESGFIDLCLVHGAMPPGSVY